MHIAPEPWNTLVAHWIDHRLTEVRGRASEEFPHPWRTALTYDATLRDWVCRVRPGFVRRQSAAGIDLRVGVTDASGRAAWLHDQPALRLPGWRAVGTDAVTAGEGSAEPVPEFFQARGVREGSELTGDLSRQRAGLEEVSALVPPEETRLLRACDLVLHASRPSVGLTSALEEEDIQIGVRFSAPDPAVPSVRLLPRTSRYQATEGGALDWAADPLAAVSSGGLDTGEDLWPIATLYLLSPPGASAPSAREPVPPGWQPFVRHHTYWNLRYRSAFEGPRPIAPLTLSTGPLAGGAGEPLVRALRQVIQAQGAAVAVFLRRVEPSGRFWSC